MNYIDWAKHFLAESNHGFDKDGMAHFSKGALVELIANVARKASSEGSLDAFRQGVEEGRKEK